MSFSAEWLSLREPIDHAARNRDVLEMVRDLLVNSAPARLTDIGSGTGSTLRALAPVLPRAATWHLVDYDAELLAVASREAGGLPVTMAQADLSVSLDAIFEKPADLVTTSAFLDLVSEAWIGKLVAMLADRQVPFYAALSYDGRAGCVPPLPADAIVLDAFNAHQRGDKGFGPALGPRAAETAVACFEDAGYKIVSGLSDWQAGPDHAAFQTMLLDGWRAAASEIRPDLADDFGAWFNHRKAFLRDAANGASVFVGHRDFLALPGGR